MTLEIRGTWDGSRGDEIVKAVLLSLSDALLMFSKSLNNIYSICLLQYRIPAERLRGPLGPIGIRAVLSSSK